MTALEKDHRQDQEVPEFQDAKGGIMTFTTPTFEKFGRLMGGETVTGEKTAWGLVLHPALEGFLHKLGYWSVSCPVTGTLVCRGDFPGRMGAVHSLVQLAAAFGKSRRDGFWGAIEQARRNAAKSFEEGTPHAV